MRDIPVELRKTKAIAAMKGVILTLNDRAISYSLGFYCHSRCLDIEVNQERVVRILG